MNDERRKMRAGRRAAGRLAPAAACTAALVLSDCAHDPLLAGVRADDASLASQAACRSLQPVSTGGPMPEGDTVVLRWLGTSNYEVAYHGKVILMDTYYERPQRTRPIGFSVADVKRAASIPAGRQAGRPPAPLPARLRA